MQTPRARAREIGEGARDGHTARARIVLADDHTLLLEALTKLLEPDFDVVGTCSDGRGLLDVVARLRPDVVVLEVGLPMLNGLDAGARLLSMLPEVKLVFVTTNPDPAVAAEAIRLGASAYLLKTSTSSELVMAIRGAIRGRSYVTPLVADRMASAFIRYGATAHRSARLTMRQREVLQLLAEGRLMKEVAAILKITTRTVAFHKYTMMDELQIKTNAELIQYAIRSAAVSV
jgi:DNA-binding NarL/FixJ family response regulator